jgi:SAM-dependent methyltransferase
VDNRRDWEIHASDWVRWARTPGHDAYWYYRDAFFDQIVPPPGQLTLEIGCGEGRVTRDLNDRGHTVVAIDGSVSLLGHAAQSDAVSRYVLSDAASLPLATGSFDQAIAYNSLMDMDNLQGAIAEVGRVLERGATFSICITHPLFDAATPVGQPEQPELLIRDEYFGSHRFDIDVVKRDLRMHFAGWSHSLEVYVTALASAGFLIQALKEPVPHESLDEYGRFKRYPMFLHLRAVKL